MINSLKELAACCDSLANSWDTVLLIDTSSYAEYDQTHVPAPWLSCVSWQSGWI